MMKRAALAFVLLLAFAPARAEAPQTVKLELTLPEVQFVLNVLVDYPAKFKEMGPVLSKMQDQLRAQLAPPPPPPAAAPEAPKE